MKTVLLVVDTWMAFRDFVRGPIGRMIRSSSDLRFVICMSHDLLELCTPEDLADMDAVGFDHLEGQSPLARVGYDWAKLLFITEHPTNTFSQRSRCKREAKGRSGEDWRLKVTRRLRGAGLGSVSLIRSLEKVGAAPSFRTILADTKPSAVIFSTVLPGKIEFLKEAKRMGIPIVLTIPTWDKPSSKGPLSVHPDWALVWSQEMAEEMVRYHQIPPERVLPTGTLYFDEYHIHAPLPDRETFCKEHAIDPSRRILHYAMAPPSIIPCGIQMAQLLHELAAQDRFGQPCHILARVSPKDDPSIYKALQGLPYLTIQIPPGSSKSGGNRWLPSLEESSHRVTTVAHSDIILTFQSSMILDACCLQRPTINLAFDAGLTLPPWDSVARYFDYSHARPVLETGATWIVRSTQQMIEAVRGYLQQPSLHAAERSALLERMVGTLDGSSCQRWMSAVRSICE